ncbi:hypothetical protein NE237_030847 [Protea cynaroides]|uniref:Uncharacterized protein n=1 Tax=Protea cynaroides TaxID=273540 RepID=A0A9Q0GV00_9MAGN|nr:hypothetical protein NE237_030847 [Protea cynaroides]
MRSDDDNSMTERFRARDPILAVDDLAAGYATSPLLDSARLSSRDFFGISMPGTKPPQERDEWMTNITSKESVSFQNTEELIFPHLIICGTIEKSITLLFLLPFDCKKNIIVQATEQGESS